MNALSWAEEKLFVLGRLSSLVNDIRTQLFIRRGFAKTCQESSMRKQKL